MVCNSKVASFQAIGAKNILEKSMPRVIEALTNNPGYNVMVIGYSLGAGICQRVVMDMVEGDTKEMLPTGTNVRVQKEFVGFYA